MNIAASYNNVDTHIVYFKLKLLMLIASILILIGNHTFPGRLMVDTVQMYAFSVDQIFQPQAVSEWQQDAEAGLASIYNLKGSHEALQTPPVIGLSKFSADMDLMVFPRVSFGFLLLSLLTIYMIYKAKFMEC